MYGIAPKPKPATTVQATRTRKPLNSPEAMTYPHGKLENQHHALLIPTSGIARSSGWVTQPLLTLLVIVCFLCARYSSASRKRQNPLTHPLLRHLRIRPREEGSGSERLNPETDVPEEGMIIGDGDDMAMVDNFVQIHGNALIKFEDVILRADHIWADFDENLMRASGNVHLIIGDEETYSDELIFNLDNKKGIARNGFTFSDPWYFGGSEIFKIQEDRSYIRGASLTTCSLKYPHYYFSVSEVIVHKDQEMIAKNIVLRIGGFPLFYFPVMRRDIRKGKIAKIIVKIGTDSYQGPNISIILPVARKRRYDGALLYDRSSKRGQGFGFEGKYRFNDTQFQEIYIPIPPDVTPNQRTKLKEKAEELQDRLDGEYDRYWLRQIFIEYKITEDDVNRAKDKAEDSACRNSKKKVLTSHKSHRTILTISTPVTRAAIWDSSSPVRLTRRTNPNSIRF